MENKKEPFVDHYEVLGVSRDATKAEIRSAHIKVILKHQAGLGTNKHGEQEAALLKVQEANVAKTVLSDDNQRARHNLDLKSRPSSVFVDPDTNNPSVLNKLSPAELVSTIDSQSRPGAGQSQPDHQAALDDFSKELYKHFRQKPESAHKPEVVKAMIDLSQRNPGNNKIQEVMLKALEGDSPAQKAGLARALSEHLSAVSTLPQAKQDVVTGNFAAGVNRVLSSQPEWKKDSEVVSGVMSLAVFGSADISAVQTLAFKTLNGDSPAQQRGFAQLVHYHPTTKMEAEHASWLADHMISPILEKQPAFIADAQIQKGIRALETKFPDASGVRRLAATIPTAVSPLTLFIRRHTSRQRNARDSSLVGTREMLSSWLRISFTPA